MKLVKSEANQLDVESDISDVVAAGHSQLQSVHCIHVKNLGRG